MTNQEAGTNLYKLIQETGSSLLAIDIPEVIDLGITSPVARGAVKNEELQIEIPTIGSVSGLVVCKALVALPGHKRYMNIETDDTMILSVRLGWEEEPSEFSAGGTNTSTAVYRLAPQDFLLIDAYYSQLQKAEQNAASAKENTNPLTIGHIKIKYEQVMPEHEQPSPEDLDYSAATEAYEISRAKRAQVIRAFKEQYRHLTILSTTTDGNIHDDEIPFLSEWLTA